MVRPRIRLGTLTLLIVIVALILGVLIERRRNALLRVELSRAQAEMKDRVEDLNRAVAHEYNRRMYLQEHPKP